MSFGVFWRERGRERGREERKRKRERSEMWKAKKSREKKKASARESFHLVEVSAPVLALKGVRHRRVSPESAEREERSPGRAPVSHREKGN